MFYLCHMNIQAYRCLHDFMMFLFSRELWACAVDLPVSMATVQYRYFIGIQPKSVNNIIESKAVVRVWETNLKPRVLELTGKELVVLVF